MGRPGGDVRIEPLGATTWPALEAFFRQGGDPRWCCQYWRLRSRDFAALRVSQLRDRLRSAAERPLAPGLVALRDGAAVGLGEPWTARGIRADRALAGHPPR